ncbi:SLBB domain-containing protein [uncultured Paraprevotella sp.]|uniref:SLBB domain-containing protein n=1 Tax=Paraprevotella clara TaxID=454154 RepID=UPI00259BD600|nr:SLBB domain-containing protein [uncultured Paraprevotella sp.]
MYMARRILLACLACFWFQFILSQSMSDDQVVRYVMEQQEKGKDQQYIVSQLLQKGVTVDQLRRIRKKYEAEQNQPGALDLTGTTQAKSGTSRLRTNKEKTRDERQKQNGYMIRSQREIKDGEDKTLRSQQLNEEIGFMDIDSLIYYRNYFKEDDRQVFGRNIFNNEMLTFEPSMNIPTPANYRLGAGDAVIIDVWGASQTTFEGTVSPDGTVTIEGVGPLTLAGMTVKEANDYVKKQLGRFYSNSNITLTVGETRSIQVQVMGEVMVPGTYTLSALSSAFNALYAAGGISEIGTLRDIKVFRQGRVVSTIDVYDYILNGNTKGDIRLADNDVIVVGPYECLVNIRGKVKRPMFYEMKEDESVSRILDYAGGFAGDAYTDNVRLIRKSGREYSVYTVGEFEMNGFLLKDGDSLYVDSIIPRFSNMAEIRGAVFHPGQYQMDGSIKTVRQLIKAADGLREDAFLKRAVMHRQKEDLTMEALSVDVEGIMDGTVADIPLRKNDILFIPSSLDMKGERTLTIDGEVNFPGVYQYADNTTIEDLVLQAGGLTEAASMAKVDVFRRIKNPDAVTDDEKLSETYSFSLRDGLVMGDGQDFHLQPYDEVFVRKSPAYSEQRNVKISGAVNFSGNYAMDNKDYRLSDLVKAAGGLSSLAYAKGARLQRTLTEEEKKQRESALKASQIQIYEESLRSEKTFDMARADSIMNLKLDLGDTYPVAINLEKAMQNPGSLDDVRLREGDELVVPQFSNTVKISGEVMYPISINYEKGKSLSYYIKRAGGYADRAHKSRVYTIYMNGSVEQLGRRSSRSIQPGCEIVVPTKPQRNKMTPQEMMTIGTSTASIATMIATLVNILK